MASCTATSRGAATGSSCAATIGLPLEAEPRRRADRVRDARARCAAATRRDRACRRRNRSHRARRTAGRIRATTRATSCSARAAPTIARPAARARAPSSRASPPTASSLREQPWRQESVIGSVFTGRYARPTETAAGPAGERGAAADPWPRAHHARRNADLRPRGRVRVGTCVTIGVTPLPEPERSSEVLVIGAGIVGVAIALRLQQEGRQVLLIDREGVAAQASRGNAGALAFSDILPLASPGIVRKAPRWLIDPLGPLAIRPRYLPRLAPWLFRFWRASLRDRVRASTAAQAAMMDLSRRRDTADARFGGVRATCCAATASCISTRARPSSRRHRRDGRRAPTTASRSQPCAERGRLPSCSRARTRRWSRPTSSRLEDRERSAAADRNAGATVRAAGRSSPPRRCRCPCARQRWRRACNCRAGGIARRRAAWSIAAGAWSHHLARTLSERIPLETERGYNTTLPPGAFDLKRQLTFDGHGFVVTPLECGVRVGGAVEFAGLDAPPNFDRAGILLGEGQALHAGIAHRRRQRVDGVSTIAAGFAARDRHAGRGRARRLRVRPRPPRDSRRLRRRRGSSPISCPGARRRSTSHPSDHNDSLSDSSKEANDALPHARPSAITAWL